MNITMTAVFGFALDTLCVIYITCIILNYLLIDTEASGEEIGLAISQALTLTGIVPWGEKFLYLFNFLSIHHSNYENII